MGARTKQAERGTYLSMWGPWCRRAERRPGGAASAAGARNGSARAPEGSTGGRDWPAGTRRAPRGRRTLPRVLRRASLLHGGAPCARRRVPRVRGGVRRGCGMRARRGDATEGDLRSYGLTGYGSTSSVGPGRSTWSMLAGRRQVPWGRHRSYLISSLQGSAGSS